MSFYEEEILRRAAAMSLDEQRLTVTQFDKDVLINEISDRLDFRNIQMEAIKYAANAKGLRRKEGQAHAGIPDFANMRIPALADRGRSV